MAWPCRESIWGDLFVEVKADFARLARAIAVYEPLKMLARPVDVEEARHDCGPSVHVVECPLDDSWARDCGPTFLVGREGLLATAWTFNAWGAKYRPFDQDARVARRVAEFIDVPVVASGMVLEGGAIFSDGEGTLVTTMSCLLNPNRNPNLSQREIELELKRMLGVEKVIWLPGDVTETETDGHIDGLMAFAAPGRIVVEACADRSDPRYEILLENRRTLELAVDARGRRFELIPIEEAPRNPVGGPRYCRSYVNYYCVNGAIIAPAYGVNSDIRVQGVLKAAYPDRDIVMVPIGAIATGGGGFHCVTQQQPVASKAERV